jgi:two-component system LytT family sensor kinase
VVDPSLTQQSSSRRWVLPRHLASRDVWLTVTPVWAALALSRVVFYEFERLRFPEIVPPVLADALQGVLLWPLAVLGCHLTLTAWKRAGAARSVVVGLASSLVFGALARLAYGFASWLSPNPQAQHLWISALPRSGSGFLYPWLSSTVEYGVLYLSCMSAAVGFLAYRNWVGERLLRERADSRAALERLRALRAQLNPHFLLNALNTLIGLDDLPTGPSQPLLSDLSELLRRTLQASERERQSVQDEVACVQAYLRIQQARFPSRVRWRLAVNPACAAATLPSLILMPLVENAVTHGLRGSTPSVAIDIAVVCNSAAVSVTVRNSCARLSIAPVTLRPALGLRHVRERLRILFGNAATLNIDHSDPEQFVAQLGVPADPRRTRELCVEESLCAS